MKDIKDITKYIESIWYDRLQGPKIQIEEIEITGLVIGSGKVHFTLEDHSTKVYDTTLGDGASEMAEGTQEDLELLLTMLSENLGINIRLVDPRKITFFTGHAGVELIDKWITEKYGK